MMKWAAMAMVLTLAGCGVVSGAATVAGGVANTAIGVAQIGVGTVQAVIP